MRRRSEARARPQREEADVPEREYSIAIPSDVVNEQVVLAAMLVDEELCDRLLPVVPADAFYDKQHQAVRAVIGEARRKKLALDPATLGRMAPDVDVRILEKLPIARPEVAPNIDKHVSDLLWDWQRAQAAKGPLNALLDAIQDPREARERVRALARQVGKAFEGEHGQGRYLRDPKEVVRQMMSEVRARAEGEAYFPYGIDGLDNYEDGAKRIRPGAVPGKITLVSALSGSGKSTVMCHLALQQGRMRRRCLFGAWEEEAPTTLESLATLALGWSRSRVLDGKSNRLRTEGDEDWAPMTHEDLVAFEDAAHKIAGWVTFFDNPFQHGGTTRTGRRPTNDDHLDVVQDHIARSGCEVFFADLLHRCFIDDSPSDEKLALARMLTITQDEKVHTIAAHQQRAKDIETRVDKKPTREGIIGAGAWLDVPWVILAPHIPSKWKDVPEDTIEVYVLKQRNGPWPLGIEFDWDADTGQISGGRSISVRNPIETSEAFGAPSSRQGAHKKPSRMQRAGFGGRGR